MVGLKEASFHPPALGKAGDDEEIPSVLLEFKAYVADCCNETTAVADSSCGREIQVTFFAARPPRVSHLCVFCRPAATEEHQEMIAMEPQVLATDDNLVLLRIVVSLEKDLIDGNDFYIYQPAGGDGPSLTRLPRPPGDVILDPHQVGILSCPEPPCYRPRQQKFYMVAALCDDESALGRGRFVLNVYNSKLQAWTTINVSVEDQHLQKYNVEGYFLHFNTRVIAIGGEDSTIAFVDLWKGILLCDLSRVKDKPLLRYVPLPGPSGSPTLGDAYRSRDIAVINCHFKFVCGRRQWKDYPTCSSDEYSWKSAIWTRPVSASSLLDDSWQLVCDMDSSEINVKSCPEFQLLPKLGDDSPFQRLDISHPTLTWHSTDDTIWFLVKIKHYDARAWVIAVDIMNDRLQGVADFDAERYVATGFGYLHSRISKYLKKTPGMYSGASTFDDYRKKLQVVLQDPSEEPMPLSLDYLKAITDDFSKDRLIGRGGFGEVYRGVLGWEKSIAIKKLYAEHVVGNSKYQTELNSLMRTRHPNIVRLLGYCTETKLEAMLQNGEHIPAEVCQRALCLEYICNGSICGYVPGEDLSWDKRYAIMEGICKGLDFPCVEWNLTCTDLKPENILIDDNMVPKITDFGLSRLRDAQKSQIFTQTLTGTLGYMPPEYICKGKISHKTDIFSLGVIMCEIITGEKVPIGWSSNSPTSMEFTQRACGRWMKIFEKSLNDASLKEIYIKQVKQLLDIAQKCVEHDRTKRPGSWEILLAFYPNPAGRSLCESNSNYGQGVLGREKYIAIKKLYAEHVVDDRNYQTEHPNIELIGYCAETKLEAMPQNREHILAEVRKHVLFFESISNGSLSDYIPGVDNQRGGKPTPVIPQPGQPPHSVVTVPKVTESETPICPAPSVQRDEWDILTESGRRDRWGILAAMFCFWLVFAIMSPSYRGAKTRDVAERSKQAGHSWLKLGRRSKYWLLILSIYPLHPFMIVAWELCSPHKHRFLATNKRGQREYVAGVLVTRLLEHFGHIDHGGASAPAPPSLLCPQALGADAAAWAL